MVGMLLILTASLPDPIPLIQKGGNSENECSNSEKTILCLALLSHRSSLSVPLGRGHVPKRGESEFEVFD
jgi:hypothetical protein